MNTVKEITNIETWKALNPELSITKQPFSHQPADFDIDEDEAEQCLQGIIKEGYLKTNPIIPEPEVKLIADAIEKIHALGLPPVFAYVYDETWQIFRRLSKIVEPILDKNYKITIAGMWAWRIDKTGSGFSIHRDIYAKDAQADGRPAHLTVWIPFTDATPENSCMHMLPINLDPNYPDNMRSKEITNYSDIRALPAKAGSILAWNANIAHWGSKSSSKAQHPRISIAMDFSRADADLDADDLADYASGPDLNADNSTEFTFEQRLNAIGESMLFYKNRINQRHADKAALLFEFCKSHAISTANSKEKTMSDQITDNKNIKESERTPSAEKAKSDDDSTNQIKLVPARKCEVRNLDGQGFGVYATEKITARERIEECHIMPTIPQDTFKSRSTPFPIETFNYQYLSGHIEPVVVLGFAGIYRHSTNCNAVWVQHKSARAFQFYALNDIQAGEEIRINYFMGKTVVKTLVPPSKIEVRESPNKGLGVFATANISEGEILEDCAVQHLGNELSASDAFADYRFNYPKGVGSKKRALTLGLGGIFNHSDDNNAYWINHPYIENVFRFVANRNIMAGEEVCTYYGDGSYWEEQGVKPS